MAIDYKTSLKIVSKFLYALIFIAAAPCGAATINVPLGGDIQAAIDSANNGDTIQLAAGTYTQQLIIESKDLSLVGAGKDVTIIQAPSASTHLDPSFVFSSTYYCVIGVDNLIAPTSQTVNISDLTVDGNNQQDTIIPPIYGNSDRFFAIGYHNANGTLSNVHTTNTRQTANFNQLAGGGIISAADSGAVVLNVEDSLIDFYQRIGIDCRGSALTGNIANTEVNRGYVLTPNTSTATPNGIQFSSLATGSVTGSTVENNIATVVNASGSGIIIFGAGANVTVSGNTVSNNDYGIVSIQAGSELTIEENEINFNTTPGVNIPEGIAVQDTDGLTSIASNIVEVTPGINIDLISSTNQEFQLSNNQINGAQTGLLVTGNTTEGPIVTFDGDTFTGTVGYYIQEVDSPNDIWPSTASVTFDGLITGSITYEQFEAILTKIYDQHNDPALGLVLDYVESNLLPPSNFNGTIKTQLNKCWYVLKASWDASESSDIVMYRIYYNQMLVDEVLANEALSYATCIQSKLDALLYTIVAVNLDNEESIPVSLQVISE